MKTGEGRKSSDKEFDECFITTKRRELLSIEDSFSAPEIQEAFLRHLRLIGKKKVANAIVALLNSDNTEESELNSSMPYSPDAAVALIEQVRLSKHQYQFVQSQPKERNIDIYPSYNQVLEAKKVCYPPTIHVSEACASVEIQSLVDHSLKRLFKDPNSSLPIPDNRLKISYLDFEIEYGIDGMSPEAKYNQRFSDPNLSDESLLTSSMVPICLRLKDSSQIVWMNPHTSSPKRCIPIMVKFAKETEEITKSEIKNISSQIKRLKPTKITTANGVYIIKTQMKLTLVDRKVCAALSDTPSCASCYICKAKPSEMIDLERVKQREEIESNKEFGLSTMHIGMKLMENVLHIGYKLEIGEWIVTDPKDKEKVKNAEQRICEEFEKKMGSIVDQPEHGSGNSNCGNTARRFFTNIDLTAEITGVDQELIERFSQILQMLVSRRKIPPLFLSEFAFKTAELYVKLYSWYKMPSSVHEILLHGGRVMEKFMLPIGMYSEEASEARNKDIEHIRLFNTRKISIQHTMQDMINKLFVSSDLYIASLRPEWSENEEELDPEIQELITEFESGMNVD